MQLWQQSMICLARCESIKPFMQKRASLSLLANRFVGGQSVPEVSQTNEQLKAQGHTASLFFLGEYVKDLSVIDQTVIALKEMASALAANGSDIHISVDPTQIGYSVDKSLLHANAFQIANTIKSVTTDHSHRNMLMLDMEDSSLTDATLSLYAALKDGDLPAAITLQAYLYRTAEDISSIIQHGGTVRLVKGAFAEKSHIAFTKQNDIDRNFLKLAETMLSKKSLKNGCYPVFATHDHRMIDQIIKVAQMNGWKQSQYEFELLYGVRPQLQQVLIKRGEQVRLYLPFGKDWWPYAIRRVGEKPGNVTFLLRSILPV